jgi:hypothetical protein
MQSIRRDIDRVTRVQHLWLLALEADTANAGQTEERLSNRMRMPRRARTWRERDDRTTKARRRLSGDHRILEDNAGECLGGTSPRLSRPCADNSSFDWHNRIPPIVTTLRPSKTTGRL